MNHLPEKDADHGPPSHLEATAIASPLAVSFGDAIHHHYYDNNAEPEKEQSSSSSDSESDDDDFFQLEATDLGVPSSKPPTAPVFVDNEISQSPKYLGWKPPVVARYDVPDPNRIPMSVFARSTAASPKDWSVASNESLFSIQMGNSSFSREQGLFMMGRSGELGNFASGPLEYPPPRPPPVRAAAEGAATGAKAKLVDLDEVTEDEKKEAAIEEETTGFPHSHSISRQSDSSSTTSFGSFAFPVLAGDEKCESVKAMVKQHAEHRPPALINPPKTPAPAAAGASAAARAPPSPLSPGSAGRRWFPCFSWCQLCL